MPPSPSLIKLVASTELKVEKELNDQLNDSLKNATAFVLLQKKDNELLPDTEANSQSQEDSATEVTISESQIVKRILVETNDLQASLIKDEINETESVKLEVNNTEDQGTIPVFSEWAQKQMQEAEQKQKQEEENGSIADSKSAKSNGHKVSVVKLRAKNYASPDCGAKILASNGEAQSTGSVLTASKDEYLLSPCTSRIWFVVELCEPIQAEKVDLANFELFSSSPKNFSVAVSNRFPTRDWSNVGQFTALDERNVQTFTLNPQLFGKFIRVDIHSHYNSEHYCPVSLFRVYGTSEFEAFETENQPTVIAAPEDYESGDGEDEDVYGVVDDGNAVSEPGIEIPKSRPKKTKKSQDEKNILKSAGEAVMNMVKKAAEVLGKTNGSANKTQSSLRPEFCMTLIRQPECLDCSKALKYFTTRILECHDQELSSLLANPLIEVNFLQSSFCAKFVDLSSTRVSTKENYVTVMLPLNVSIAICNRLKNNLYQMLEMTQVQTSTESTISEQFVTPHTEILDELAKENEAQGKLEKEESKFNTEDNPIADPKTKENESSEEISDQVSFIETIDQTQIPPSLSTDNSIETVLEIPTVTDSEQAPNYLPEQIDIKTPGDPILSDESTNLPDSEVNGNNSWENLESLLILNGNANDAVPTIQPSTGHNQKQGHPESVFLRLSNRIKVNSNILHFFSFND